MRTDFPAPIKHFIEETIVVIISQHQSESFVLCSLLIYGLIRPVPSIELKAKSHRGNGLSAKPITLVKHNKLSRFRGSVRLRPQPVAGEIITHAKTKAIGLPKGR